MHHHVICAPQTVRRLIPFTAFLVIVFFAFAAHSATLSHSDYGVIDHVDTKEKVIALTFDADMTPKMLRELRDGNVSSWYNGDVVAELDREKVPATFFLTGMWIEAYPTTTRTLSNDSLFELGNHSYSHGGFGSSCWGLNRVKESQDISEIKKTDVLLRTYATSYVRYFRFPELCQDAEDARKAQGLGYTVIGGAIHGGDGFQKNAARIVSNVVSHVKPGSIVVLHLHGGPDAPQTAVALPIIISELRAKGYSFLKVSDLLKLK